MFDPFTSELSAWGRRLLAVILCLLAALLAWLALSGCAPRHRPARLTAPPPAVPVQEVRRAVAATKAHGLNAQTAVQTVIRDVERLKLVADPATAAELEIVRNNLVRADEELVKLRDAVEHAAVAITAAEKSAEDLRLWGVAQQQIAEANAEGWRRQERQTAEAQAERDKARAVAHKRGNLVGMLGASTLGFLGLKFFTLAVPWTAAIPLAGTLLGYFGARWIL